MQTRTNSFLKNTRQFLQNNLFYSFSVAKYTDNIIMPATKSPTKTWKNAWRCLRRLPFISKSSMFYANTMIAMRRPIIKYRYAVPWSGNRFYQVFLNRILAFRDRTEYISAAGSLSVLLEDVHKNKMMKYVQITGVNGSTLTVKEHTYMLLVSNDTVLLHVSCFSADRQLCRYKTSTAAVSKNGIEKHCLVNNIKILEKKEI